MPKVVLQTISKEFPGRPKPVRALSHLTLEVQDKELLVLAGPSGCGKTTVLRLIAGLETPTAGAILFDGLPAHDKPARERDIAMVFQSQALYPHMTVYENLAFGLEMRRIAPSEIRARVVEIVDLMGLGEFLNRRPQELSGGESQRVALARALVRKPALLLLDEPLSSLDAQARAQLRADILRIHRRLGITTIYVTHDPFEAMVLADRLAVLRGGALQQIGTARQVYGKPANVFVAGFFGSPPMNLVAGELVVRAEEFWFIVDTLPTTKPCEFAIPAGVLSGNGSVGRAHLGVRPEHLSVGSGTGKGEIHFHAQVQHVHFAGAEVHVDCVFGKHRLIVRAPLEFSVKVGSDISLSAAWHHLHMFQGDSQGTGG